MFIQLLCTGSDNNIHMDSRKLTLTDLYRICFSVHVFFEHRRLLQQMKTTE